MTQDNAKPTLTHLDASGGARMVNVSDKPITVRRAVAEGRVRISAALAEAIRDDSLKKGNALEIARLAGIQATKHTATLIPLCHALPIDGVSVELTLEDNHIRITSEVCTTWKTGVEMEALTAVSVAALTVIDMGKSVDKTMAIEGVRLLEKTGGKSGDYRAASCE